MNIKHTPLPWTMNSHGEILSNDGDIICQVYDNPGEEEGMANELLFFAAPDMLAALETARDALEWYKYDNGEGRAVAQGALKEIKAAFDKANSQPQTGLQKEGNQP